MADEEEPSMDEILESIRNIMWNKEVEKSASRSCIRDYAKEESGEVLELQPEMIVPKFDLPYEYTDWNFDDVAERILHKYTKFFAKDVRDRARRVSAKADSQR